MRVLRLNSSSSGSSGRSDIRALPYDAYLGSYSYLQTTKKEYWEIIFLTWSW